MYTGPVVSGVLHLGLLALALAPARPEPILSPESGPPVEVALMSVEEYNAAISKAPDIPPRARQPAPVQPPQPEIDLAMNEPPSSPAPSGVEVAPGVTLTPPPEARPPEVEEPPTEANAVDANTQVPELALDGRALRDSPVSQSDILPSDRVRIATAPDAPEQPRGVMDAPEVDTDPDEPPEPEEVTEPTPEPPSPTDVAEAEALDRNEAPPIDAPLPRPKPRGSLAAESSDEETPASPVADAGDGPTGSSPDELQEKIAEAAREALDRVAAEEIAAAEAEAARAEAALEEERLRAEDERIAAEDARLAAAEAAREMAEAAAAEAAREAAAEEARQAVEAEARRIAEQERKAAEEEARERAEAEEEEARQRAEAERKAIEEEARKLAAEEREAAEEEARQLAEAERKAIEEEARRLAEAEREAAAEEARRLAEAEAARREAEAEAERIAEEQRRMREEIEAMRRAEAEKAEQEALRQQRIEQQAAERALELERARIAREREQARLAAEEEARAARELAQRQQQLERYNAGSRVGQQADRNLGVGSGQPGPAPDPFLAMLGNAVGSQGSGGGRTFTGNVAAQSNAAPLTPGEQQQLLNQLAPCWQLMGQTTQIVTMRVSLSRDGRVTNASPLNGSGLAVEHAYRALQNQNCQPFQLPPQKYGSWQQIDIVFDPRRMTLQ